MSEAIPVGTRVRATLPTRYELEPGEDFFDPGVVVGHSGTQTLIEWWPGWSHAYTEACAPDEFVLDRED
jgi:hypothetical protein